MKTMHKILIYTSVLIISIVFNFFLARYNTHNEQISRQCGWHYENVKDSHWYIDTMRKDHTEWLESNLLPSEHDAKFKICLHQHGNELAHILGRDICYDGIAPADSTQANIPNDANGFDSDDGPDKQNPTLHRCIRHFNTIDSTWTYGKFQSSIRPDDKVVPILSDTGETPNYAGGCWCTDEKPMLLPGRVVFKSYERAVQRLADRLEQLPEWKIMGGGEEGNDARRDAVERSLGGVEGNVEGETD